MNNTKVLKRKGARQFCVKLLVFFSDRDRTGIKFKDEAYACSYIYFA